MADEGRAGTTFLAEPAAPGVAFLFSAPKGLMSEDLSALPGLNVKALRGAEVVLFQGAGTAEGLVFRAACVRAPSDLWAPALSEVVFGQATWLSHTSLEKEGLSLIHLEGKAIEQKPPGMFTQDLWGSAHQADGDVFIEGRHSLAFVGSPSDALLCTLLCRSKQPKACAAPIAGSGLYGPGLGAQPVPKAWIRLLLLSAEYPRHTATIIALVGLMIVFIVLWRRPRPGRYGPPKKAV